MINQVRFSNSVMFFEAGFCKRWNVYPYNDINAPCLFIGVYDMNDVNAINNHKGFKVIMNTGKIRECFSQINPENVVVKTNKITGKPPVQYKTKEAMFQMKDFSMFKPNILGDKIYCYLGNKSLQEVMGFSSMEKLRPRISFEIIYGFLGNSIEYVKEQYYDKCFVNIKPNPVGGTTTAVELAYMGRKTISNAEAPFCINYKNIDHIVDLIKEESKKIGTIQPSCVGNFYNTGEEWKQVKFWL